MFIIKDIYFIVYILSIRTHDTLHLDVFYIMHLFVFDKNASNFKGVMTQALRD